MCIRDRLYRTGIDAKHQIVLYEYKPNRKAENAEKFLDGFNGWLHADGYDGYHKLNNGCLLYTAGQGFSAAFASLAPSFHLLDLCMGAAGAVLSRLVVYSKGKSAKKYRRGIEYGSARWSA